MAYARHRHGWQTLYRARRVPRDRTAARACIHMDSQLAGRCLRESRPVLSGRERRRHNGAPDELGPDDREFPRPAPRLARHPGLAASIRRGARLTLLPISDEPVNYVSHVPLTQALAAVELDSNRRTYSVLTNLQLR